MTVDLQLQIMEYKELARKVNVTHNNTLSHTLNHCPRLFLFCLVYLGGIPQGTVLGPLLFLCYSADLPSVVKHGVISMFADDTNVYKGIHSTRDCYLLQQGLNSISTRADLWQMELNPDKTKVLPIGDSHKYFQCKLQGNVILRVSHMKYIGVIIQSSLKYTVQYPL